MTRWIVSNETDERAVHERRPDRLAELATSDVANAALASERAVLVMPGRGDRVLVARIEKHAAAEAPSRNLSVTPIADALRSKKPVVAEPKSANAEFDVARWEDKEALGYQAGGMLGLLDEPVYEEEKPKKWWQKILD